MIKHIFPWTLILLSGLTIQALFQLPQSCGEGDKKNKLCQWLKDKGLSNSQIMLGGHFSKYHTLEYTFLNDASEE